MLHVWGSGCGLVADPLPLHYSPSAVDGADCFDWQLERQIGGGVAAEVRGKVGGEMGMSCSRNSRKCSRGPHCVHGPPLSGPSKAVDPPLKKWALGSLSGLSLLYPRSLENYSTGRHALLPPPYPTLTELS